MNGKQFIRKVRKAGRRNGVTVEFDKGRGKGGHGTLYYGGRRVVVPVHGKDLHSGLLARMLAELGLTRDDL